MREHDLNLLRIRLQEIKEMGWVKNQRPGNAGGVGNTLEDLLDVAENNLQLPDFGDWELKSQRAETGSLLTLFHSEPKPRNARIVPQILLSLYGWPHQDAGTLYPTNERSFRQTINAASYSARGFKVNIDWNAECIFVSFDYQMIDNRYDEWRRFIKQVYKRWCRHRRYCSKSILDFCRHFSEVEHKAQQPYVCKSRNTVYLWKRVLQV